MQGPAHPPPRLNPLFHVELADGSDANTLLVELKGPKQFSVGFQVAQVSSHRQRPFESRSSGDFRSGCTALELDSVPSGTYSVMPMTFLAGQEGPFLLRVESDCSFTVKRVR